MENGAVIFNESRGILRTFTLPDYLFAHMKNLKRALIRFQNFYVSNLATFKEMENLLCFFRLKQML